MTTIKDKKPKYRLFKKVIDKSKPQMEDRDGGIIIPAKWVENNGDLNLGSIKKPNPEVFEVKLEPIKEREPNFFDMFGGMMR